MKKISWFSLNNIDASGETWYSQGYFNAAINTISALQKNDCAVFYNNENIPFHVNFCSPHYYQFKSKYNIGYTPWESTKVPASWRFNMSNCNEIWATSNFVKNVYLNNNVHTDIHVIPHGITDDWQIYERELSGKFNFIHVGGDSKRKNAQLVVDAFLELFDGDEDYQLILKYNNFCHAEVYIGNNLVPAIKHPQIIGIGEDFSVDQLVKLYHKCHCMVYPTSGEGFGLIPLEAMATGIPTIVTNATGCEDYANLGIPLDAIFTEAEWHNYMYNDDTGLWASPNFDQLISLMQNVVDEYDDISNMALNSAKIIHSEWSWSAVADKILARLHHFENTSF
ncbi:MAG: hypothetical protein RL463_1327 [Bacteroidota bacterium]